MEGVMFAQKLFTGDRPCREALVLLAPEFRAEDLTPIDPKDIGPRIADLGERLYHEGSLPGLPSWEKEVSPEFDESVKEWRRAIAMPNTSEFTASVKKTAKLANAGFYQMGRLAPKLAALRWNACIKWICVRAELVNSNSAGGAFGTIDAKRSADALIEAKEWVREKLWEIVRRSDVLAMIDHDLVGNGVWHRGGREPLPEAAANDWYRRGSEFDVAAFCLQAYELPPLSINEKGLCPPMYFLKMPYGEQDRELQPYKSARCVIDQHHWTATHEQPPIDPVPSKALLSGPVLHVDKPPDPQFDFDDPEVIAKVQRGEDLGKGDQEDWLPGAIHGSIGILYALVCRHEAVENIRFYPRILPIPGFVEHILRYGPPFRGLDFGGCEDTISVEVIKCLPLAGETLNYLDLEGCGLGEEHVEVLVDAFGKLKGLRFVDLSSNNFDADDALELVRKYSQLLPPLDEDQPPPEATGPRTIRFDSNPLGSSWKFRDEVVSILAERGGSVLGGGQMVLHLDNNSVFWELKSRVGSDKKESMAATWSRGPQCFALKDLEKFAKSSEKKLEKQVEADAKVTDTTVYQHRHAHNQEFLNHPLVGQMRDERNAVWAANHEAEQQENDSSMASPPVSPGLPYKRWSDVEGPMSPTSPMSATSPTSPTSAMSPSVRSVPQSGGGG